LIFINGIGAIAGPVVLGWMMDVWGAFSFFTYLGCVLSVMAAYALYRMTRRAAPTVTETASYAPVSPSASPVAVEWAQEIAIDMADDDGTNSNIQDTT